MGALSWPPGAMPSGPPGRARPARRRPAWSDKAGNAPPLTDPTNGRTFPDLNAPPFDTQRFDTNLVMLEPCPFLSTSLAKCSIIRQTETQGAAMAVVNFLTAMGLFIGQPPAFFNLLQHDARDADSAVRQV